MSARGSAGVSGEGARSADQGTWMNPARVPDAAASSAVKNTWLHTNVPAEYETSAGMPASAMLCAIALTGSVAK